MKSSKYSQGELEHQRIAMKMSWLDKLSVRVAIGFVLWGIVYIGLWVMTIVYFF